MKEIKNKTKTQRILEYVQENPGAKAYEIAKAAGLELRQMKDEFSNKSYKYYVGWSGFRNNLCQDWEYGANPDRAALKREKNKYYLTSYGKRKLEHLHSRKDL